MDEVLLCWRPRTPGADGLPAAERRRGGRCVWSSDRSCPGAPPSNPLPGHGWETSLTATGGGRRSTTTPPAEGSVGGVVRRSGRGSDTGSDLVRGAGLRVALVLGGDRSCDRGR